MKNMNRKERYGLRKLSIGLASVLLSIAFYKGTVSTVQAATEVGQSQQALTSLQDKQEVANSKANKTAAKLTSTKAVAKAKTAPVPASQAAEQQPQAKTVQKADSIAKTAASKSASPQSMQAKLSKTVAKSDKDSKQAKAAASEKVEIDKLGSKDSKINKDKLAKELKTSLRREAIPPASQYDPSKPDEWGQVDIDDWDYDNATNNGSISLTGYHGNRDHIVIPNDQDFIKTKNHHFDPGQGVYISSDKMRNLLINNPAKTLAISQTNHGKVIAGNINNTDQNWSNAFGCADGNPVHMNEGFAWADPYLSKMDLTNLETHNIKYMHNMLAGPGDRISPLTTVGDLSGWDLSNCVDIDSLFLNERSLVNVGDLGRWDTSKIGTDPVDPDQPQQAMSQLFQNDWALEYVGDLSSWNTSHVLDMEGMFAGTKKLSSIGDIGSWDVSQVDDFDTMFDGSGLKFIGNLSNWKICHSNRFPSSLTRVSMNGMFEATPNLTNIGDLSGWNTSHVIDMQRMFNETSIQILNISGWDFQNIHNQPDLAYFATENKDQIIIANNLKNLPNWITYEIFESYDNGYYHNNGHDVIITNSPILLRLESEKLIPQKSWDNSRYVFNGLTFFKKNANGSWVQENQIDPNFIAGFGNDSTYTAFYMPTFYDSKGSSDALAIVKAAVKKAMDKEKAYLQTVPAYRGKDIVLTVDTDDLNPKAPLLAVGWANALILISTVQKQANLLFEDDETGATLSDWVTNHLQDDEKNISFGRQAQYILNHLRKQGYVVVAVTEDTDPSLEKLTYFNGQCLDRNNPDRNNPYKWKFATAENDPTTRIFTVHLMHDKQNISDSQTITETIHYVYEDGTTAKPDYNASVSFKRSGIKDLVTGQIVWGTWTPNSSTFRAVTSPLIPGYTADPAEIAAQIVNANSSNLVFTVVYRKNQTPPPYIPPKKPGHKPGSKPGNHPSNKPGQKPSNKPNNRPNNKPNKKPNSKPSRQPQKRSFQSARHLTQRSRQLAKKSQQQLPQTGSQEDFMAAGLLSLALSAALAANDRKKYRQ